MNPMQMRMGMGIGFVPPMMGMNMNLNNVIMNKDKDIINIIFRFKGNETGKNHIAQKFFFDDEFSYVKKKY